MILDVIWRLRNFPYHGLNLPPHDCRADLRRDGLGNRSKVNTGFPEDCVVCTGTADSVVCLTAFLVARATQSGKADLGAIEAEEVFTSGGVSKKEK
ncbi:hypothetical protein L1987_61420 [Smallanthus sonchifolius]|uniref:Uncharacterized protein n=1 Tax=Smallanthus sonchifolius TaxID=185202 RepID=A0ACB9C7K3_9ASTR|nr:hypothetical protein L1987_61420 [Smallanthus sonchifolius]